MSIHDNTKNSFAEAIKKLLLTKDLHQIRVKELCDMVGAKRPTFYYHFQDKYELISWIYEKDMKQAIDAAKGHYNVTQLEHLLITMRKEQIFYQRAFADVSQNNLYTHIHETNLHLFAEIMQEHYQLETLTQEQIFTLGFYTHAWIGALHDWIHQKYNLSAREYATFMYSHIHHLNLSDVKVSEYTSS